MPVPSPGGFGNAAGAGGSSGQGGGSSEQVRLEAEAKDLERLIKLSEANIKVAKETIKQKGFMSAATIAAQKLLDAENKSVEKNTKLLAENAAAHKYDVDTIQKAKTAYVDSARTLKGYTDTLTAGIAAHHQYALGVQFAIDKTSGFSGKTGQARQQFESFRRELNLTRDAAIGFSETWAESSRLGIVNKDLERMAGNLQKIYGQSKAIEMTKGIIASPMGRSTAQGVARGDTGSVATAMRSANLDQAVALAGTLRRPEDRSKESQQGARFENAQAWFGKIGDDLKASIQAVAASGFPPEVAAMLAPLASINEHVAEIAANTEGWLASIPKMVDGLKGAFVGSNGMVASGVLAGTYKMGRMAMSGAGGGSLLGSAGRLGGKLGSFGGGALKKGGLGLAALAGSVGLDYAADRFTDEGSATNRVLRGTAGVARVAGGALSGAAMGSMFGPVGTGIGAAVGGGMAAWEEYGDVIKKGFRDGARYFTESVEDTAKRVAKEKEDQDKSDEMDILVEIKKTQIGIEDSIGKFDATLKDLPSAIQAGMAQRGVAVGALSGDRNMMARSTEAIGKGITESMNLTHKEFTKDINDAIELQNNMLAEARNKGFSKERTEEVRQNSQVTIDKALAKLQENLQKMNLGQRGEAAQMLVRDQRAQTAQVRERASSGFELSKDTGDVPAILKYREEMNSTYSKEAALLEEGRKNSEAGYKADIAIVEGKMKGLKEGDKQKELYENELKDLETKLRLMHVSTDVQENVLKAAQRREQIESQLAETSAYSETREYMRAQKTGEIAQTKEEFLKKSGGSFEDIGAAAKERTASAESEYDLFMKTFQTSFDEMTRLAHDENLSVQERKSYETRSLDLTHEKLRAEQKMYDMKMNEAISVERHQQGLISGQKRILEIQLSSLGKIGGSWRSQLGIQSQIIRMSQEDLSSSRRELDAIAKANPGKDLMKVPEYVTKLGDVTQKQADLQEAILGKQRSFLEQAMSAGFGMGGGSKVLPNINPRIFGEVIRNSVGMQQSGAPLTMEEQRGFLMQNMGPNVFGGVGGGLMAPPVAPGLPAGGPMPGPGGPIPGPGAANGKQGPPMDVSGNIEVAVRADQGFFIEIVNKQINLASKAGGGALG